MKRGANQLVVVTPGAKRKAVRSYIPRSMGSGLYAYKMNTSGRYNYKRKYGALNRRGVASPESGFVDLAAAGYAADTTGTINLIATVAQGASTSQRVGKRIKLKSLQIRGNVQSNSTTTIADAVLLIVYDRRPTGSLPAITDILVSANSTAFNNDANSDRFKIIRRFSYSLGGNSTAPVSGNETVDMDEYVSLRGLPCVYKALGTGAIGDIAEGALYAVTVGSIAAGTAAASIAVAYRTRYMDV